MTKRLLLLNGLSIIAVVFAHATSWTYCAMFWWTDRYRAVAVPNYDLLGSPSYYAVVVLQKLCVFCVPAFLFTTGVFVAYASRGQPAWGWRAVVTRLRSLLIPYVIWSVAIFAVDLAQGIRYAPLEYVRRLVLGEAVPAYYYVILLVQLYLLSLLLVRVAKTRGRAVIVASAGLLLGVIALFYTKFLAELRHAQVPRLDRLIHLTPSRSVVRFVFFFALGLVSGFHLQPLKRWLTQYRRLFLGLTVATAPLAVLETELIFRLTGMDWRGGVFTLTGSLYAIGFVLSFLAFDGFPAPLARALYGLGSVSFGIYLLHTTALEFFARALQKYVPRLLAYPVLFQLVLTGLAVGSLWLFSWAVAKSPARRYHRYLLG